MSLVPTLSKPEAFTSPVTTTPDEVVSKRSVAPCCNATDPVAANFKEPFERILLEPAPKSSITNVPATVLMVTVPLLEIVPMLVRLRLESITVVPPSCKAPDSILKLPLAIILARYAPEVLS